MKIEPADRVKDLPPYLFAAIDKMKSAAVARGQDIIDLGVGDPDLPTPEHIIEVLRVAAGDPVHHQYPSYQGMLRSREAARDFYAERFGVALNAETQALTLIGSKEGIAHMPLAIINPGDLVLVPDPAYPVYETTTRFVGGEVFRYGLQADNQFLPDLEGIPAEVSDRAKMIVINYPNNPTGGVATLEDYERILAFAQRHDLIVLSDLAYSEMFYEDPPPPSFLELPGAMERSIEFYSLSKTYNMTGWRVAYALGNEVLVGALGKIKTNVDSGVFGAVQEAGITALQGDQSCVEEMRQTYRRRRDLMMEGLKGMGLDVLPPRATFYVFARIPNGIDSLSFAGRLLEEQGIVATPGVGFGERGEGFIRFTLTVDEQRIAEVVERMKQINI